MLSNAYFLAKFRFDTAENEPAKYLQHFAKFANFANPNPLTPGGGAGARRPQRGHGPRGGHPGDAPHGPRGGAPRAHRGPAIPPHKIDARLHRTKSIYFSKMTLFMPTLID